MDRTSIPDRAKGEPEGSESCTAPSPARSRSRSTPRFLADRSSPENGYFFWAYTIELTNRGRETVQLKTRHWRITDAHGRLQEVRGAGVVGEEPVLKPGENFEYTSGVPLPTPSGFMTGSYGMVTDGGEHFDIDIPAFSLDTPAAGAHDQLSVHPERLATDSRDCTAAACYCATRDGSD